MVLLEHMGYSRYDQASDSLCRLYHSFSSLRPWHMNQTLTIQKECIDCRALHLDGVSDHAPMGFEIKAKNSIKPATRRMNSFITKSLSFNSTVQQLSRAADLHELDPV